MINFRMFKKLLLSFLAAVILLVSVMPYYSQPARAQVWYDQGFEEWFVKVYDESNETDIFGERYTAAQVQWVVYGLFSFMLWGPLKSVVRCFMTEDVFGPCADFYSQVFTTAYGGEQNYYAKGQESKSLLSAVFEDRSLSGVTYFKDIVRKFHLIPEAQAQTGFGFEGLSLVRNLWTVSRNIAYLFFVIAIIIMAFMIMFRVKISPQVVITVQSALPKIFIALVLITFSYAIAGLLVDFMYVLIGIFSLLVADSGLFPASSSVTMFNWLTKGAVTIIGADVSFLGVFGMLALYLVVFMLVLFYALLLGGGILQLVVGNILTAGMMTTMAASLSIFAAIILFLVIIFISLKIIFTLLKAFASVLLLTIIAPLQIAVGIFVPGVGFGAWVRSFLGHLAVFPLTGLLITLAYIFLFQAARLTTDNLIPDVLQNVFGTGPVFTPTEGWPPLLGVGSQAMQITMIGVSLTILFIVPKTADLIKSIIQGRPFAFGTAIGEAMYPGPIKTGVRGGAGSLFEYASEKEGKGWRAVEFAAKQFGRGA